MNVHRIIRQSLHSGAFYILFTISRLLLALALGKTLSSHEYGSYALIVAFVGLVTSLVPLSAFQYYMREIPGRPSDAGASIFKSIVATQTLVVTGLVVLICVPSPLREALRNLIGLAGGAGIFLAIGGLVLADSLATEFVRYLYSRTEIEKGNITAFLQNGLWPVVIFGLFLLWPTRIRLFSLLMVWLGCLILAILYAVLRADPRELLRAPFRLRIYPIAIRFGVPLVLTNSVFWATAAGRFILSAYHSKEVVGVFTYNHNLILMIAAMSAPLIGNTMQPYVIEAYNAGQTRRSGSLLSAELRYRIMLVLPFLIVAVMWDEDLIKLLARADYVAGHSLMALLSPIPLLGVLGTTFERVLFLQRRTGTIARCYLYAAGIQLVLYLLLVPFHPYAGAAVATDIGLGMLVILLWYSARGADVFIEFSFSRVLLAAAPSIGVAWALARSLPYLRPLPLLILATAFVSGSYLLFVYFFRALSESEIRVLRDMLSGGRRGVLSCFGLKRLQ